MAGELKGVQIDVAYNRAKSEIKDFVSKLRLQHGIALKTLGDTPISFEYGYARNYREKLFMSAGFNDVSTDILLQPIVLEAEDRYTFFIPASIKGSAFNSKHVPTNIVAEVRKSTNYIISLSVTNTVYSDIVLKQQLEWTNTAKETKEYQLIK